MRLRCAVSVFMVMACASAIAAPAGASGSSQEKLAPSTSTNETPLRVDVDEVIVTFHAEDASGVSIKNLKSGELRIRDNGVAPRRVVAFEELTDRPIRAGILLDASGSMQQTLPANKEIAKTFIHHFFRPKTDAAFVSSFGHGSDVLRTWTGQPMQVVQGIASAREESDVQRGTALFNAIFRACSYSFDKADPAGIGNLILLFSDGEDNAGLTSLDEAARACQGSNTAVFAFLSAPSGDRDSSGPQTLRELAEKTGGRVFRADDSSQAILDDLREIESEMRNQYRLVYNPADLKHDGSFHQIELQPSDRVNKIAVRSGYFAPQH